MDLIKQRDKYVAAQGFKTEQMRRAIEAAWTAGAVAMMTNPPAKPMASSLRERLKGNGIAPPAPQDTVGFGRVLGTMARETGAKIEWPPLPVREDGNV